MAKAKGKARGTRLSHGRRALGIVAVLLVTPVARAIAPDAASRLPPCHLENAGQEDFYPDRAQRAGTEGRVLVEFSLDEQGRPTQVAILRAEPRGVFESTVQAFLQHARCLQVLSPSDRTTKPSRYRMGFVFRRRPCTGLACTPVPYEAANGSITITARQ